MLPGCGRQIDFVMENIYWKKSIGSLIGAIWLYTLADIAANLSDIIGSLFSLGGWSGSFAAMAGGGMFISQPFNILGCLLGLLTIFGYVYFYISLSKFMHLQQSDADYEGVRKVRMSYILIALALLAGFFWIVGKIIGLILVVIAYIKMLSGYNMLKKSATYTERARRGANMLFYVTIFTLIAKFVGFLPFIGDLVETGMMIILFFCTLASWRRIQLGAPELSQRMIALQEAVVEKEQRNIIRLIFCFWVLVLLVVGLMPSLIDPGAGYLYQILGFSILLLFIFGFCLRQSEKA